MKVSWLRWREPPIAGMPHGYRLASGRWVPWFDRLAGAIESPLARALLHRAPDRPIFLVGAFRSGTTLVERLLCRHPQVASFCYFSNQFPRAPVAGAWGIRALARLGVLDLALHGFIHNPKLPSNLFSSFECEWIYSLCGRSVWDAGAPMELDAGFRDAKFERHLLSLVQRHLWLFGRRRFVNKNPFNSLRIGFLARLFPDARFVRVLRHPLATVDSHHRTRLRLERALLGDGEGARVYREGLRMDVLSRPARTRLAQRIEQAAAIDARLGIAEQWSQFQEAIDTSFAADPALASRVHEVRYEELLRDPRGRIAALLRAVDLDDDPAPDIIEAGAASIQPEPLDEQALAAAMGPIYPRMRACLEQAAGRCGYALPG